ncbi:hypothetical protein B0H12DRAFT_98842 [Mycena haematopus]|nr:hypothetical protein B0H12DRAFT_98842 [Mycena haematopus]
MSSLSLSSAAPSSTTLQALSDYCASSDSPSPDSFFSHSDSRYSFVSELAVGSPSSKAVPKLPDIIVQADRFQSPSVQEKMSKALRFSTGSGFTRSEPSSCISRRNRAVSTQALYEGFPPSPSDYFFNDASVLENSTPVHVGLGIFVPSSSTSDSRLFSPLASRSTSPTPGSDAAEDQLSSRLLLSPISHSQLLPPSQTVPSRRPSNARVSPSQYANLGLGLPSERKVSTASTRFGSGFTLSSMSRVFSIIPSASYARTLFNGLPKLTRCSPFDPDAPSTPKMGRFASLRSGAANFVRRKVSGVSAMGAGRTLFQVEYAGRALRMARDEG